MKTILTIILICIFTNGYGQNPFNFTFGGNDNDGCTGISLNGDTLIMSNTINNFLGITTGFSILYLNNSGDSINAFSSSSNMNWTAKFITNNKTLASTGRYRVSNTNLDMALTCVNNGVVASYHYGGSDNELGYDFIFLPDSGFIIVGTTESYGAGANDAYIIRTDKNGDSLWTRTFGQSGGEIATGIEPINDSVFYVCGTTTSFGAQWSDVFVMKLNDLGDTSFLNIYGNWGNDVANAMVKTHDKGYAIAGWELYNSSIDGEFLLLKIDSNANQLFLKTYGYQGMDEAFDIKECYDHGFIMVGYSEQPGRGEDVYIVRTDSIGDTLWTKTIGGAYNDRAYSVVQTPDSGFAIVGNTYSYGAGGSDAFFLKLKPNGDITTAIGLAVKPKVQSFSIFPNPAKYSCSITFDKPSTGIIQIRSISGTIINSYNVFSKKEIKISISSIAKGMYIIVFLPDNSTEMQYSKLIIQ